MPKKESSNFSSKHSEIKQRLVMKIKAGKTLTQSYIAPQLVAGILTPLQVYMLQKRQRHKLYKSCSDHPIFRRCLLFDIGRSSPDFFDLEPCRKSQAADVCLPPPGDCSATARFALQMTKFLADGPTTIGRWPSGDWRGTCQLPSDANKSYDHRQVAVRASCGHRRVCYR